MEFHSVNVAAGFLLILIITAIFRPAVASDCRLVQSSTNSHILLQAFILAGEACLRRRQCRIWNCFARLQQLRSPSNPIAGDQEASDWTRQLVWGFKINQAIEPLQNKHSVSGLATTLIFVSLKTTFFLH